MRQNKKLKTLYLVLALVLCVFFGFMLLFNLVYIVKGVIVPDKPPSVFGIMPMVVKSGSMSGSAKDHIEVGDLIFIKGVDIDRLNEGSVISFMENGIVVTHRIVSVDYGLDGKRQLTTKGDANNAVDEISVTEENLLGVYQGRIPKLGDFAMFLQEPLGMILFMGLPLCSFIIYDIVRRQRQANRDTRKTADLEAELERLRALADESKAQGEGTMTGPG